MEISPPLKGRYKLFRNVKEEGCRGREIHKSSFVLHKAGQESNDDQKHNVLVFFETVIKTQGVIFFFFFSLSRI